MSSTEFENIRKALKRFQTANILVIGDIIIDHFIWGTVSRISPEAPVPVVNVTHDNLLLGGSANVLNNIYDLGGKAAICGIVGSDVMGDHIVKLLGELDSPVDGIIRSSSRPTTIKTRIIAQHQQVVRFDREETEEISRSQLRQFFEFLDKRLHTFNAVVVSDYAKGIVNKGLMNNLRKCLASHPNIPLVIDPKPGSSKKFAGATLITPNHHEAEQMSGVRIKDEQSLKKAGETLLKKLESKAVLITRGEAGMSLFEKNKPMVTIPTTAKEVFDVTGAGDTVIATLAMGLATGLSFVEAATIANYAAGIVVGKLGTATASREEILEGLK